VWCLPLVWVLGSFIPPPSPGHNPEQVVTFFREHTGRKESGLFLVSFVSATGRTWTVAIGTQLKRIESVLSPWVNLQMLLGALLAIEFFPTFVWQAMSYRPETTSTELTSRLNNLAWLPFVGVASTRVLQAAATGVAILVDGNPTPINPRWLGHLNFWVAMTSMPAALVVFLQDGPFAGNGTSSSKTAPSPGTASSPSGYCWWGFVSWMVVVTSARCAAQRGPQHRSNRGLN
jgi:hypothetical protein